MTSSLSNRRMTISLFEYDVQMVLDEGKVTGEILAMIFPIKVVLYLRSYKKILDKMKYMIKRWVVLWNRDLK